MKDTIFVLSQKHTENFSEYENFYVKHELDYVGLFFLDCLIWFRMCGDSFMGRKLWLVPGRFQ